MGLNFYYYDGLQPKMRAAIINEHECSMILVVEYEFYVYKIREHSHMTSDVFGSFLTYLL